MICSTGEPLNYLFSLSKFFLIVLLLYLFYILFIRRIKTGSYAKTNEAEKFQLVQIELLKNNRSDPTVVSLIIRNTGTREVELEAPVIVFRRWMNKRKFRIRTVEFSQIYPIFLAVGESSVLRIGMEQFYRLAPEIRRWGRMSVEISDVHGSKFKSGNIRLKGW